MTLACGAGESLVNHFNTSASLPGRLVSSAVGGILSSLVTLLPSVQRGSAVASVCGYLLTGILISTAMIMLVFSRLPAQFSLFNAPAVDRVGSVLLPLLGAGLLQLLKQVVLLVANLSIVSIKLVFSFILLLAAGLTYSARRPIYQLEG